MNAITKLTLASLAIIVMLVGCQDEKLVAPDSNTNSTPNSLSKGGPVVQSATGSGHFIINDELRTFSFTARKYNDGSVDGMAELHNRAGESIFRIAINCLYVLGDNVSARMSGYIVGGNRPDLIGSPGIFEVYDDGEGVRAQDMITLFAYDPGGTTPLDCAEDTGLSYFPIESGNVQVRP